MNENNTDGRRQFLAGSAVIAGTAAFANTKPAAAGSWIRFRCARGGIDGNCWL